MPTSCWPIGWRAAGGRRPRGWRAATPCSATPPAARSRAGRRQIHADGGAVEIDAVAREPPRRRTRLHQAVLAEPGAVAGAVEAALRAGVAHGAVAGEARAVAGALGLLVLLHPGQFAARVRAARVHGQEAVARVGQQHRRAAVART